MKLQLALIAGLFSASSAFAAGDLLVLKEGTSGFVPPQYAYSLKCEVYSDYAYVEKTTGGSAELTRDAKATVYTQAVPNAKAAIALAKLAAKGKMVESIGPTDGPTSKYVAVITGPVVDSHVKLYTNYSSVRFRNSVEKAVKALTEFADENCAIE